MTFTEKIGNQWYRTKVVINGDKLSRKMYPLMARIFGKKEYAEDTDTFADGYRKVELFCCIYKGRIYIYKEIITTSIKIDGPKDKTHDQEFYKNILNSVRTDKTCPSCSYAIKPRKCYNRDIIALHGGYTKANYLMLTEEEYKHILLDKNCPGYENKLGGKLNVTNRLNNKS